MLTEQDLPSFDDERARQFMSDNNLSYNAAGPTTITESQIGGKPQKEEKAAKKIELFLQVSIPQSRQIADGFMGSSSYTVYEIETKSNVPKYDPSCVYKVIRRFSDFEWILLKLQENPDYKGLIIPPLPTK